MGGYFISNTESIGYERPSSCRQSGDSVDGMQSCQRKFHANSFFFFQFFYRSSSALISLVLHLDPVGPLGHLLCRGPSQCPFFVSGSSEIRTQVLLIRMRTLYRYFKVQGFYNGIPPAPSLSTKIGGHISVLQF